MSKKITAYECPHCRKLYRALGWCLKHEPRCGKNPRNQHPCYGCKHFLVDERIAYIPNDYGADAEIKTKAFACSKKGVDLYSHKIDPNNIHDEQRYSSEEVEYSKLERMPNMEDGGCSDYIDPYQFDGRF